MEFVFMNVNHFVGWAPLPAYRKLRCQFFGSRRRCYFSLKSCSQVQAVRTVSSCFEIQFGSDEEFGASVNQSFKSAVRGLGESKRWKIGMRFADRRERPNWVGIESEVIASIPKQLHMGVWSPS